MIREIKSKKFPLAVIGLGYVGLPIALEFAKELSVIGFDINEGRIKQLQNKEDPSKEISASEFDNKEIIFTSNSQDLEKACCYVIAVPTPIDKHNLPDLKPLLSATATVGTVLKKGDYVIYESTVYPGCTEEDCVPELERISGLKFGVDFKVGYSPERINPGDKKHSLAKIIKVVSGSDQDALNEVAELYSIIITAGVHKASCIKVAEAAKIIENTQRDVNIALMNELSIIFNRIGINTFEVLEAAGTKWNFLKFTPGLVGGHCIGVDPYYLSYKARGIGYHARMINSGRFVNDTMGFYIAKQTVKLLIAQGKNISGAKVLVMGATFKENVSDIRNSKVTDLVKELYTYNINVQVVDNNASPEEFNAEYGIKLSAKPAKNYDAIIVAVNHDEFLGLDDDYFDSISSKNGIFIDVKGIFRGKIKKLKYWSL